MAYFYDVYTNKHYVDILNIDILMNVIRMLLISSVELTICQRLNILLCTHGTNFVQSNHTITMTWNNFININIHE